MFLSYLRVSWLSGIKGGESTGGAWIYDLSSNEELERLLAVSPVYNFSHYKVYLLAEMDTPADIIQGSK